MEVSSEGLVTNFAESLGYVSARACRCHLPSTSQELDMNLAKLATACTAVAALLAPAASAVAATPIWNITSGGLGSVTATNNADGSATGTYAVTGSSVYSTQTWTFSAVATENADYTYDWNYSGFHAYFQVYAQLDAFGGLAGGGTALYAPAIQNCCTSPSAGFSTTGTYHFGVLNAGDVFGFVIRGRNADSTSVLQGKLDVSVSAVPEPETFALAAAGLGVLVSARRRRTALRV